MELLTIFMGFGLVFAVANVYLLNLEVDRFKTKAKESKSDIDYFKKAYAKYYDKYLRLTQPEVVD